MSNEEYCLDNLPDDISEMVFELTHENLEYESKIETLSKDLKNLETRRKSLITRNRNLNYELKKLATENQNLQEQLSRLSSGEAFQELKRRSEELTLENSRLISQNIALTAGHEALSSDLDQTKNQFESLRKEKNRLANDISVKDGELRIRRIATRSLAIVLTLCLALGLYVSSRFSDLEESFTERISEAEERIEEAESRATLAERRANKEKTRADDAEERLEEFLPSESNDNLSQADPNYTIALYSLRAAEQQGLLREHLEYLDSCGVDITVPPYSDFVAKIEPEEPPKQGTPPTTVSTTEKPDSGTSDGRLPASDSSSGDVGFSSSSGSSSVGSSSTTGSTNGITIEPPTTGYVVYITETGAKYHLGHCSYLAKSKIEIDRSKAIAQGYTPCSRCDS